jgi:hypothetical protein
MPRIFNRAHHQRRHLLGVVLVRARKESPPLLVADERKADSSANSVPPPASKGEHHRAPPPRCHCSVKPRVFLHVRAVNKQILLHNAVKHGRTRALAQDELHHPPVADLAHPSRKYKPIARLLRAPWVARVRVAGDGGAEPHLRGVGAGCAR